MNMTLELCHQHNLTVTVWLSLRLFFRDMNIPTKLTDWSKLLSPQSPSQQRLLNQSAVSVA
jgi:hypothetical protein